MNLAGSSILEIGYADRDASNGLCLVAQSARGDQAVELWFGSEMEQEANR